MSRFINDVYESNTDYYCIITGISKIESIKVLQNIDLTEKSGTL